MLFSWIVLGVAAAAAFVYRRVKKRRYEFPDGVCAFVLAAAVIKALGHAGISLNLPEAAFAAAFVGVSSVVLIIRRCLKKPHTFTDDVLANVVLFSVCALVESLGDVPWIYTMLAICGLWGVVLRQYRRKELGTVDYILGLASSVAAFVAAVLHVRLGWAYSDSFAVVTPFPVCVFLALAGSGLILLEYVRDHQIFEE